MAVVSVMEIAVKPGRTDEFVAGAAELDAVLHRIGEGRFRGLRLFRSLVGGPYTGTIVAAFEYDDLASWGASNDREVQDGAWRAVAERLGGPDGPATVGARELYEEIALR
jgi:hypothetical protein